MTTEYGPDSSFIFDIHCSMTSFFFCSQDQLMRLKVALPIHVESFDTTPTSSPGSMSTFSGSPVSASKANSGFVQVPRCMQKYIVEVGEYSLADNGYVIIALRAPCVKNMIDSFACTQESVFISPKHVNHITLARERSVDVQELIFKSYVGDGTLISLFESSYKWDVVLFERCVQGTLVELVRIPLP